MELGLGVADVDPSAWQQQESISDSKELTVQNNGAYPVDYSGFGAFTTSGEGFEQPQGIGDDSDYGNNETDVDGGQDQRPPWQGGSSEWQQRDAASDQKHVLDYSAEENTLAISENSGKARDGWQQSSDDCEGVLAKANDSRGYADGDGKANGKAGYSIPELSKGSEQQFFSAGALAKADEVVVLRPMVRVDIHVPICLRFWSSSPFCRGARKR
ncbi:hypothetical protein O6H91_21G008400 [Diphasiastrum complanatum]|uniref:Uncharacterized protein n=1 Tax=Diphasiastrum complanatum TaxID=34168 RepID=A0ACC2AHK0_DIPCM|nr:hypothetical protein O6H91_21G008400 [Diphasiastrum complanatum]